MSYHNQQQEILIQKLDLAIRLFEKLLSSSQSKKSRYSRRPHRRRRRKPQPANHLPFTILEQLIRFQLFLLEKSIAFTVSWILGKLAERRNWK